MSWLSWAEYWLSGTPGGDDVGGGNPGMEGSMRRPILNFVHLKGVEADQQLDHQHFVVALCPAMVYLSVAHGKKYCLH